MLTWKLKFGGNEQCRVIVHFGVIRWETSVYRFNIDIKNSLLFPVEHVGYTYISEHIRTAIYIIGM